MTTDNWIGVVTVIVNILIALGNIIVLKINVGKNRTIYESEEITVNILEKKNFKPLNEKLSSGNYTILNVMQESNPLVEHFIIGKINP